MATDGFSKRTVGGSSIDTSTWGSPDIGALGKESTQQFLLRKRAVELFLNGASAEEILRQSHLSLHQASRLVRERCLHPHMDGNVYGWRGLVPYLRLKPYKRKKPVRVDQWGKGAVGALDTLLDRHPDLRERFDARIKNYAKGSRLQETNVSAARHHAWFIAEVRSLGYEANNEWPFGTESEGYYSVRRHIAKTLATDPVALAGTVGGPDLVRKRKSGDGSNRPGLVLMQRVEMDAHKLDGRFCVSMPQHDGSTKERMVYRLWVIVIIEVVSRAVLGYYFSLRKEVSADDVLRTIKRALSKWDLRSITFSDQPYRTGAGLPSTTDQKFVGLCWDETSVDGALAETCQRVKDTLQNVVGSVLLTPTNSFSKRRSLDDRPFIETFFRNLAGRGFQRLSNTTGGKSSERKGKDPDKVALTSRFQYEYAEELLDVLIANYNATPHKGISNRTPLEYARFLMERSSHTFRYADSSHVESTCSVRKLCRVRGGAGMGRGQFVEFFYGLYTNEILQAREDLAGKQIWVILHKEDDARIALASTQEGVALGVLRAAPPWNQYPHSLPVRTAIKRAIARGQFSITPGADGVETFLNFVEAQPSNKLPIYPAYLEARRILSAAVDHSVGDRLLKQAQDELELPTGQPASKGRPPMRSQNSDRGASTDTAQSTLPPRRPAAT